MSLEPMKFIVVNKINDICVKTQSFKLSEVVEKAEDYIEEGLETNLIICKEFDNSEAKKKNWTQPARRREFYFKID